MLSAGIRASWRIWCIYAYYHNSPLSILCRGTNLPTCVLFSWLWLFQHHCVPIYLCLCNGGHGPAVVQPTSISGPLWWFLEPLFWEPDSCSGSWLDPASSPWQWPVPGLRLARLSFATQYSNRHTPSRRRRTGMANFIALADKIVKAIKSIKMVSEYNLLTNQSTPSEQIPLESRRAARHFHVDLVTRCSKSMIEPGFN